MNNIHFMHGSQQALAAQFLQDPLLEALLMEQNTLLLLVHLTLAKTPDTK